MIIEQTILQIISKVIILLISFLKDLYIVADSLRCVGKLL